MKLSKAQQAKADFIKAIPSLGWPTTPDRFGHYKVEVPVEGSDQTVLCRLKIQKTSWRIERQSVIPAGPYSPEHKIWVCLRCGYFNGRPGAPHAKVPVYKSTRP